MSVTKSKTLSRIALGGLLCTGVSMLALATAAQAETAPAKPADDQVVIVKGVRGSQLRTVELKKKAIAQVDAISAEDIGKLPDVTIADSLQRVSGVQIVRDAGEGAAVNIRGLAQTITLFNGEQYLSAGNIGQAQANFLDVPSQLLNSVVVYKSTDPRTPLAGVSGTIDLQTRRPFQFAKGVTLTGAAERSRGDYTKGNDYSVNALFNWRNDRVGFLVTAAASDSNLGNNYSGFGGGVFSENDWGQGNAEDYISPHGFEIYNRAIERKRTGVNAAFQAKLGEGWTLTAETFYTHLEEHNRAVGLNISNRWDGAAFGTWLTPTAHTDTGLADGNGTPWWNVSQYDINAQWLNSFTVNRTNHNDATNFNLELKYDNGGKFTMESRFVGGRAHRLSMNGQVQGDLSNWQYSSAAPNEFTLFRDANDRTRGTFYPSSICSQYPASQRSNSITGSAGGCYLNPNPLGYESNPLLHVNSSGGTLAFSGFEDPMARTGGLGAGKSTADYMANLGSYKVAAYSSEGNNDAHSDLQVARMDGHYKFDEKLFGLFTKVDAGVRTSERGVDVEQFHLFSSFYANTGVQMINDSHGNPVPVGAAGCAAQWKAIDVVMNNPLCSAGEYVPNSDHSAGAPATIFQGYTVNKPTALDTYNPVTFVTGLGGKTASGIPGFWAVDPKAFDDEEAFMNKVFGKAVRTPVPGQSFDVQLKEDSAYVAGEFEKSIFSGNVGVRVIRTNLRVRQNVTSPVAVPYGDDNFDNGDQVSERHYVDVLPSFNLNADVTENLKLRFAWSKTMQPLDLGNYGGGVSIATNDDPAHNRRVVTSVSFGGNPNLDPWRSTDTDFSAEYYLGRASMVNLALFNLDIKSFVTPGQILSGPCDYQNSDNTCSGVVQINLPLQGSGGQVQGLELGGKFAFKDFWDAGLFSNFGVDTNMTLSPSHAQQVGLDGKRLPFVDNSKTLYNLVGWYQDEKLQVRVAYNYRSERLRSVSVLNGNSNVPTFADPTGFVDLNATYNINDHLSLYLNGSNVTGEVEKYYYHFGKSKQFSYENEFESRYTVGIRAKW
ncbi:TonB-dependent receptor [Asticcacaulis solisilvae]|uniref:TonB-dependent receptor n=1 Tax=Asticcacaulis solisilvae TaxID=1217274 RepID=UPI003FD71902